MTAPLSWLLLSALALLAPTPHGPAIWTGSTPAVFSRPSQPVSGHPLTLVVAGLPHGARRVVITGIAGRLPAQRTAPGIFRARLDAAPAPGPLSLGVRFALRGRRYQSTVGVLFVVPATSGQ
jgi:hypothetical protein